MARLRTLADGVSSPEIVNTIIDNTKDPLLKAMPRAVSKDDIINGRAAGENLAIEKLNAIGEFLSGDPVAKNAFLNELVNMFVITTYAGYAYKNKLGYLEKGEMPMGWGVRELFVDLAKPYDYLITEKAPNTDAEAIFALYPPNVKAAYFHINYRKNYRVSTTDAELKLAFSTYDGVRQLVMNIIQSMYNAMAWDEELAGRYCISRNLADGNVGSITIPPLRPNNGTQITTTIKETSLNMDEYMTTYNASHVLNRVPVENQLLLVSNKYDSSYTVEVQSAAFNLDKVAYLAMKRTIRSFSFSVDEVNRLNELFKDDPTYRPFNQTELAELEKVQAVLLDRKYTQFYRNYLEYFTEPDRLHLKYNHFLHIWKTYALSPFANVAAFISSDVNIESITVSPTELTISKGQSGQLTATVNTVGFANKTVVWEIVEPTVYSSVSETGIVKIGANETNSVLHVKVTSAVDLTKSATATINIPT